MRRLMTCLVLLSLVSIPAAARQNAVDRIFYSDCGPNRVVVGEIVTDCNGQVTSWGQVTDFEERRTTKGCDGPTTTTYWECGTQVTSLAICIC